MTSTEQSSLRQSIQTCIKLFSYSLPAVPIGHTVTPCGSFFLLSTPSIFLPSGAFDWLEDIRMPEITPSPFRQKELVSRRQKIAKACDFCREHRVRCESITPCPQCVANNVACHRSRPSKTPQKRKRGQDNNTRSDVSLAENDSFEVAPTNDSSHAVEVETAAPTPSPEENLAWTSHKTDSMLGFIARINAFCSGVSQLSPDPTPPATDPSTSLDHEPSFPSNNAQRIHAAECDLSSTQIDHLLQIFWTRIRPQMPIVEWKDLKLNGQPHATPSPLLDAVIAYSLQYIYQTGLYNRLIGLKWPKFQKRDRKIGMPYFRRCLSAVTQITTFANPSISTMQCYCYLVSYLLDAGEHQAAYNMVGLGLRFSQTLNYMDARTGGYRECQLFRRIWWTLIHLDFRCSRHIGKPVTGQVAELLCVRPNREPQDVHLSNGLLYHTESIRLTAAALLVNEATDHFALVKGQSNKPKDIEERAKNLSDNLFHLQRWRDEMPKESSFANIQLDVPDVPPEDHESDPQHDQGKKTEMETLLSTLLTLQYHNVIMSLHRVFIQFPSHPLVPKSNPKADAHAATALNHALRMIGTAHQRMKIHEIFHGHSEFYQYQWNAVITIIGFMLAYPYCHRCSRARHFLNLALEIFESLESDNVIAVRAATLTRHLCSKVDTLIRTLNIGQPTPDSMVLSGPTPENQTVESVPTNSNLNIGEGDDSLLQDLTGDSLWSWADFINLDAWPSYCDEVSEAFLDTADFSIPSSL